MVNEKPIKKPMALNGYLDLNEEEKSVDQKVYHSMIGSLLYICSPGLDIMLSVCMWQDFKPILRMSLNDYEDNFEIFSTHS